MARLKMHWWVLMGIVLGAVAGAALHAGMFQRIESEARLAVLRERHPAVADDAFTPAQEQAASRAIQARQKAIFRDGAVGGAIGFVADLFLRLLRFVVVPLVFLSLATGVVSIGDPRRLGRLGARTLAWYLGTSLLAILTGLLLVNAIRPGEGDTGIALPRGEAVDLVRPPDSVWQVVLEMIPSNPVAAAAEGNMFGIIFAAFFFGVFTLLVGEPRRGTLASLLDAAFEVVMRLTLFFLRLAPLGIAALIAELLALSGPRLFVDLIGYVATVAAGLLLHFAVTLPLLMWLLTRRNPYRLMRAMSPALLTGFSTASSSGTLPITLERLEHAAGIGNRTSSFVVPLGATVNMNGTALYEIVATLFVAQLYAAVTPGFDLTLMQQATIVGLALAVSIGAAGIPSAGLVMMIIIFEAVGLPLELTALLWSVDRVLDMFRTTVNIWGDMVGAATLAHFDDDIDEAVLFGARAA